VRHPHPERRVTILVTLPSGPVMIVVTRDIGL
jgi:hypothetical protein